MARPAMMRSDWRQRVCRSLTWSVVAQCTADGGIIEERIRELNGVVGHAVAEGDWRGAAAAAERLSRLCLAHVRAAGKRPEVAAEPEA